MLILISGFPVPSAGKAKCSLISSYIIWLCFIFFTFNLELSLGSFMLLTVGFSVLRGSLKIIPIWNAKITKRKTIRTTSLAYIFRSPAKIVIGNFLSETCLGICVSLLQCLAKPLLKKLENGFSLPRLRSKHHNIFWMRNFFRIKKYEINSFGCYCLYLVGEKKKDNTNKRVPLPVG